jgi:hypothetical protein
MPGCGPGVEGGQKGEMRRFADASRDAVGKYTTGNLKLACDLLSSDKT